MHSFTPRRRLYATLAVLLGLTTVAAMCTSFLSADENPARKGPKASLAKRKGKGGDRAKGKSDSQDVPKNIEYAKAKKTPGRTNLPRVNDKTLGRPITALQLDQTLAEDVGFDLNDLPGKPISDEQFIRRVYLDVIGRLPAPADIEEYVADKSNNKKDHLIERLLSMPQYGLNWGTYWRDVVAYRSTAGERPSIYGEIEWLEEKFNSNRPWSEIVTEVITPHGYSPENPQSFFLGMHMGQVEDLAGETARIFMGLQIACAQCHDHPTDVWKRDQFHEFASFYGKTLVRQRPDLRDKFTIPFVLEITEAPARRQYRKPDLQDPTKPGEFVTPMFLTGQAIGQDSTDGLRRKTLATLITSKTNPYFARAFVNRLWCELMGRGFISPVDDLGFDKEADYPKTFDLLSRSFAASNYDIKQLFRTILMSQAYDRKFMEKGTEDPNEKVTVTPTRLTSDQLFDSLDWILGGIDDGRPTTRRAFGARGIFKAAFGFDPSLERTEIEGSIPQALALMNSSTMHSRIDSDSAGTLLNKLLKTHTDDKEVLKMLYLRVLARKPTSDEAAKCMSHIRQVGDRAEAFEDVLWALLNCTEFLHNH